MLHVRGTDRLLLPSPEEVRPPPLAFYLYAALIHGSKVVRIVTDDSSDPLVEELVSRLDSFGIEATFSGGSLNEDISCLANAKTLVLPGSSLSDSIAGLSSKVERIFLFEGKFFTRDDVLTLRIEDTTGSWRRSYEDIARDFPIKVRKLMASFSYEALSHRVEGDIRV